MPDRRLLVSDSLPLPQRLWGRDRELAAICQILVADGDLLLTGVPGVGRRTLLRFAATHAMARLLEIDCLRITNASQFLAALGQAIAQAFPDPAAQTWLDHWATEHGWRSPGTAIAEVPPESPVVIAPPADPTVAPPAPTSAPPPPPEPPPSPAPPCPDPSSRTTAPGLTLAPLVWPDNPEVCWERFQQLLEVPQYLAEALGGRVVVLLEHLPHIRTWDRDRRWETHLRERIQHQTRVSYVLLATIAEDWARENALEIAAVGPVADGDLQAWAIATAAQRGWDWPAEPTAIRAFGQIAGGHFGSAIALMRRLEGEVWGAGAIGDRPAPRPARPIATPEAVQRSALTLLEDLSPTFEALLLLLPPSQVRLLESLAIDPTDSPHARHYARKHQLSRGGSLQGALASLQQKGLVYGSDFGYRIALPLLRQWLAWRLR